MFTSAEVFVGRLQLRLLLDDLNEVYFATASAEISFGMTFS